MKIDPDAADWLRHAFADQTIRAVIAESECARLREAIRRLVDRDATLSVCDGSVTVTLDGTITDAEREAIHESLIGYINWMDDNSCRDSPDVQATIATLRNLLERLT